jgi:hypothetical protein
MAEPVQNFSNHRRFFPLFHFTAVPLLLLYLAYSVYVLVRAPSLATAAPVVLAVSLFCTQLSSRLMALSVQNRVIRLEMQLRLERLLGPAAREAFDALTVRQLVALRFASDAELPALVQRVRSNELATSRSVKQAIRDWRADFLRA